MTSSTSTTCLPRSCDARNGSTANAPLTLPRRSLRSRAAWAAVCRTRNSKRASVLAGARARASSSAWLKPRSASRWPDSGIGTHHIRFFQCGLHPGRAAHQRGEASRPAGLAVELVVRDQSRPRKFVGDRGMAGVQRRRVRPGSGRIGQPRRQPEWRSCGSAAGAGRTARRRLRTAAGRARHGKRRTGRAGRPQALRSSAASSDQYTRSHPYGRPTPAHHRPRCRAALGQRRTRALALAA